MPRLNLHLPITLNDFLEKSSHFYGGSKAKALRNILSKYLSEDKTYDTFSINNEHNDEKRTSFNVFIEELQYKKIAMVTKRLCCTKIEFIRSIIQKEFVNNDSHTKHARSSQRIISCDDVITQNIKTIIKSKNFFQLNNYLYGLLHSKKESELLLMGEPHLLVSVINQLQYHLGIVHPELLMFKIKMLYYIGNTNEALHEIKNFEINYQDNSELVSRSNIFKGQIYCENGKLIQAREVFESLYSTIDLEKKNYPKVTLIDKLGLTFFYSNKIDTTLQYYENALKVAQNNEELAISHRYLGTVYYSKGDYVTAEKQYKLSLSYFKKCTYHDPDEYIRLLLSYAELRIAKSDWIYAEKLAKNAYELSKKMKYFYNISWASKVLSSIQYNLGNNEKAYHLVAESIDLAEHIDNGIPLLSRAYHLKSMYLINDTNLNEAEKFTNSARFFEKKYIADVNYNTMIKWSSYTEFLKGQEINLNQLQRQSNLFKNSGHIKDQMYNDYILAYLLYNDKKVEQKSRGEQILKRLLYTSIKNQYTKLQFGVESVLKFNQFNTF